MSYDRRMTTYAQDERQALCALLDHLGPGEPTLCEGWRTGDLAAHLVLRDRRPDAALGMAGGPLAGRTQRLQDQLSQRTPFPRLVEMIRTGPPRLSLSGLPGVDERANAVEFFVHHEDARRGQPQWEPRDLPAGLSDLLWDRLRLARQMLRRMPVGVELARAVEPGGGQPGSPSLRLTVRARTPMVTVAGTPGELTLWVFGRTGAAQVRFDGSDADISTLAAARK